MKRRDLLKTGLLGALVAPFYVPSLSSALSKPQKLSKKAKNIIFMVSDGMSIGTLTLSELMAKAKYGTTTNWINLYRTGKGVRSAMETSSANSLVTDSSAGSSAWGCGMKVNNNVVNIGPNGEMPVPILQKYKSGGKSVGCVTTVPITHATPAGFCVNNKSRKNQPEIATQYLDLRFDVMMGGGLEFFSKDLREDGRDLFSEYDKKGYSVAKTRDEMFALTGEKPIMAVFSESALPFTVDRNSDESLQKTIPTLSEMLKKSLQILEKNPNGFVMQVEGGKVDWAAHSNDAPALVYDQLAFDDAVGVALAYAEEKGDTLVVITTDHGNANPGLFYGRDADKNFEKLFTIKHSNDFVFQQIPDNATVKQVIETFETHQSIVLKQEQAEFISKRFLVLSENDKKDGRKLPFEELAMYQRSHFNVNFASMNHSGDFVELAMFGPGSEALTGFTVNSDLHQFMLHATETVFKG